MEILVYGVGCLFLNVRKMAVLNERMGRDRLIHG
jgi:hypothetical protein